VRLVAAGTIAGRVLAPDGTPVGAGVQVVAWTTTLRPGTPGAYVYAYTGAGGEFLLDGLTADRYSIAAGGGGSRHAAGDARQGVARGESGVEVTVAEAAPLSGRLVDPRGNPVQAQTLQTSGVSGIPNPANVSSTRVDDREGRFLVPGVRRGRVALYLYRDGKSVALGEFDAPAKDLKVLVPDP
jgi:hypothetical protein